MALQWTMPEDLDRPIAEDSFLRLPGFVCVLVVREADESFCTGSVDSDVCDGAKLAEPVVDRAR